MELHPKVNNLNLPIYLPFLKLSIPSEENVLYNFNGSRFCVTTVLFPIPSTAILNSSLCCLFSSSKHIFRHHKYHVTIKCILIVFILRCNRLRAYPMKYGSEYFLFYFHWDQKSNLYYRLLYDFNRLWPWFRKSKFLHFL